MDVDSNLPKQQVPGFGERAARSLARCAAAENCFIRAVGGCSTNLWRIDVGKMWENEMRVHSLIQS